ncbi:FKBP-type peptidyl-prolyl cis-trans isomerase [Dermabacteraceae bacterium P7006]
MTIFTRRALLRALPLPLAALTLAACEGEKKKEAQPANPAPAKPADAQSLLAKVQVSQELGQEPKVTLDGKLDVTQPESQVLVKGDGARLTAGSLAIMKSLFVNGADGQVLQSSWQGALPEALLLNEKGIGPDAFKFLTSANVGSRLLMLGKQETQQGPLSLVQVADVIEQVPGRAVGKSEKLDPKLPKYTLGEDGNPILTGAPEGQPPQELVVATAIKGAGRQVKNGDTLVMQYRGWGWDGKEFDSSWQRGSVFSFQLGSGQVIQGWDKGLLGATVGSQLLLVIPPALAYGNDPKQHQLGGQTLIFVVDLLHSFDGAVTNK